MRFTAFLDVDLSAPVNTFFNEAGDLINLAAPPQHIPSDRWEIGEPGYYTGDLLSRAVSGALKNRSDWSTTAPDDVAFASSLNIPALKAGQTVTLTAIVTRSGQIGLMQRDTDDGSQRQFQFYALLGDDPTPAPGPTPTPTPTPTPGPTPTPTPGPTPTPTPGPTPTPTPGPAPTPTPGPAPTPTPGPTPTPTPGPTPTPTPGPAPTPTPDPTPPGQITPIPVAGVFGNVLMTFCLMLSALYTRHRMRRKDEKRSGRRFWLWLFAALCMTPVHDAEAIFSNGDFEAGDFAG